MHASSAPRRRILTVILALAALTLKPTASEAQGGLFNKAKEKLAPKPEQTGPAPKYTDTLLELTDARVDAYLKGIAAGQQVRSPAGLTIPELNRKAEAAFQARNDLLDGKDKELQTYNDARHTFNECLRDQLHAIDQEHQKEMAAKMSGGADMALLQAIQKYSMEYQQKFAAGDTAGALRAQEQMMKALGVDAKADTAKARSRCGKEPVKPKWLSEAEAQLKAGNEAMDQARQIETRVNLERAKTSGMTEVQFGLVHERVVAFINADGKPSASWKYSAGERDVLKKRTDEIRKAVIG